MQEVTHVSVPVSVLNKTLGYLSSKPFGEVFEIIAEIKSHADASIAKQRADAASEIAT